MKVRYFVKILSILLFVAMPPLSGVDKEHIKFTSRHGFSLIYPSSWFIDADTIERYSSLMDAQKSCANHIEIYNYGNYSERDSQNPLKNNDVKIEINFYNDNAEKRLNDQLVKTKEIIDISRICINSKVMYKIVFISDLDGEKALTVVFKDNKWFVRADCDPYNSIGIEEFYKILGTMQFNK